MAHNKVASSDTDRLVSLAGGTRAYVFCPDGTSRALDTRSEAFTEAVAELVSQGHAKRVRAQIDALAASSPSSAWPEVAKNLEVAGVFSA